jgi:alpha-mannosidase II
MSYLRTAEMLHSWTTWEKSTEFEKRLEQARRALSIFQHHDGVTGTAKDYVMKDYDEMMIDGIKNSKFVIQQAVYRLLTEPNIYHPDYSFTYFNIDDSRSAASDDTSRSVIIIGEEIPHKYVVIHNSQTYQRNEVVEFLIAKPYVCVTDADGNSVDAQITPSFTWHRGIYQGLPQPQFSTTKYRLIFTASVPALGLSVYKLNAKNKKDECPSTTFSQITIFTDNQFSITLDEYPEKVTFAEPRETSLRINENSPGASFNKHGILKSLSQDSKSSVVPVHLEFMKYGTRTKYGQRSGAYLFLPDGPAQKLDIKENPTVVVVNGQLEASISTGLSFVVCESILRSGGDALEIRNSVDIRDTSNTEVIMRLSTNIKNDNVFYTDLNGMQYMKRRILKKIPLQGNYYPISAGMFIEDDTMRLSLFTSTPLGGSSLNSGEMEIMQDRRLNQDDERGE